MLGERTEQRESERRPELHRDVHDSRSDPGVAAPDLSVVVPIVERFGNLQQLTAEFSAEIARLGFRAEWIFVVDERQREALPQLREIQAASATTTYAAVSASGRVYPCLASIGARAIEEEEAPLLDVRLKEALARLEKVSGRRCDGCRAGFASAVAGLG